MNSEAKSVAPAQTKELGKKDVKRINKSIKHHVRAIQHRLHRLAVLKKKEEHKLDSIKEPVTFCERAAVEDKFAKKSSRQAKKLDKHVRKTRDLSTKLAKGGALASATGRIHAPAKVMQLIAPDEFCLSA